MHDTGEELGVAPAARGGESSARSDRYDSWLILNLARFAVNGPETSGLRNGIEVDTGATSRGRGRRPPSGPRRISTTGSGWDSPETMPPRHGDSCT